MEPKAKLKKFFPLMAAIAGFIALSIAQMSMHGTSSSASKINLENEKAQVYEAEFGKLAVKTTQGKKITPSQVSQPIVILNFWASWCRPCLSEFESMKRLMQKFGEEKVLILGINTDTENPLKAVEKTQKKHDLAFDSAIDPQSEIASRFLVDEIPTSFVFHKGKLIHYQNKEFNFMNPDFVNTLQEKLK